MGSEFRIECGLPDADATHALGRAIGARLESGDGVALVGDLGAGKTTLTRGIAEGLGIDDPGAVTSPTYLVVVEHRGPVPLVHVDAYLPEKTRGFLLDGGVDYLGELGGVVVVEWADRIADLMPEDTLRVVLAPSPEGGRVAQLCGGAKFEWVPDLARTLE
ncbi:MAG: tRNA (adenosine(37)-N6)-threonylcarbamoyltransferase complex ATPase subunit type 1 TsaE [Planctomycetes bacterium]|nr:tRNA (adenosine(37)-N6)-threonylcarbamoyltransferase complex ATPase subunit type 1 TsaE [Planctomycetota bacterium]